MSVKLKINETFNSIQTEGVLTGRPAYFIRVAGCNLKCSFCDTDHKKGKMIPIKKIIKKMQKEACSSTVILTGGEPMLYDSTTQLVTAIIRLGWIVQIETNGTYVPKDFPFLAPDKGYKAGLLIVCSPKTKEIHPEVLKAASCFKYTIQAGKQGKDGLPRNVAKPPKKRYSSIMLSPMFTDNKKDTQKNIDETVKLCLQYGYYMSYQYHKPANFK